MIPLVLILLFALSVMAVLDVYLNNLKSTGESKKECPQHSWIYDKNGLLRCLKCHKQPFED